VTEDEIHKIAAIEQHQQLAAFEKSKRLRRIARLFGKAHPKGIDRYPEPGPIFVHAQACEPHAGDGFPDGLRPLEMTLEAFGDERWMLRRERLDGREPEPVIEELLAMPEVRYVNIRNSEAGCFIARVERS